MARPKLSQYLMACGHHGHRWDSNGKPQCAFCRGPEGSVVAAIEPERRGPRRRTSVRTSQGRDLFGEEL